MTLARSSSPRRDKSQAPRHSQLPNPRRAFSLPLWSELTFRTHTRERVGIWQLGVLGIWRLELGICLRRANQRRLSPGVPARARSIRAASGGKAGVGPVQRSWSTSPNTGMSVRSVARSRNRNARSRSRASVADRLAGFAALTPQVRQSAGNRLEMAVTREHRSGGLRAPAGQAGVAVGGIADEREVIGNRRGPHAELRHHARFVQDHVRAPVQLHDARAADATAPGPCRACRSSTCSTRGSAAAFTAAAASASSASYSTIGQTVTPSALQRLFEQPELRQEVRVDARAGLVSGPQAIAERLDDVIGGDADVRGAAIDHAEHRADHAAHGADLTAVARRRADGTA